MANAADSNYAGLNDFSGYLTPEQSGAIFEQVENKSVVQQLGRQVTLGPSGKVIPVFTEDPSAGWVGEGQEKPITSGGMDMKNMEPKKIAAIFVASAEVVRANPGNYMNVMRDKVAAAFASAFDKAALHGVDTPFAASVSDTTKSEELTSNVYQDLNDGLGKLVNDGYTLDGFALDPRAEPVINSAVDASGRPLFIDTPIVETNPTIRPGRILGRPAYIGKGVALPGGDTLAFAGNWDQIAWGVVGGISFDVSDQATLPLGSTGQMVSLWQNNLVAVRAEAEYGLVVNDPEAFVAYTNSTTNS